MNGTGKRLRRCMSVLLVSAILAAMPAAGISESECVAMVEQGVLDGIGDMDELQSAEVEAAATNEPNLDVPDDTGIVADASQTAVDVTVTSEDGAFGGADARVVFDFDGALASDCIDALVIEVTKDGAAYEYAGAASAAGSEYALRFTEVGAYTVTVKSGDVRADAPAFNFDRNVVTVSVARAAAPVELEVVQVQYDIDGTVKLNVKSSLGEGYAISALQLVATNGDQSVESELYTGVPDEATLVLPEQAQLGRWQVGAVLTIINAETGEDVTECFEPVESAGFDLGENGIAADQSDDSDAAQDEDMVIVLSRSSFIMPYPQYYASYMSEYDREIFDVSDLELVITRNGEPYTPSEDEISVDADYAYGKGYIGFQASCVGDFTIKPKLKDGVTGYVLAFEEFNIHVPQAEAVLVETKYNTYYPGDDVNAELQLADSVLSLAERYFGDQLDSVTVWLTNGDQTSEVINVDADDIGDMANPYQVSVPLNGDAEPGEWEIHAEMQVSRDSGEDVSANYKLSTGTFTVLPSERKTIKIGIDDVEITSIRPVQAHFDVQVIGAEGQSLEELIDIEVEHPDGALEDGAFVVTYNDASIDVTVYQEGRYIVYPVLKEGIGDYVIDPVAKEDREIRVLAANYDTPYELSIDKQDYFRGDDIIIHYTPLENLQPGHEISAISLYMYNDNGRRINLDTPNTPASEFDVSAKLPDDMETGEWYVGADVTIVDAQQNDVSDRYYGVGNSVMFAVGKRIAIRNNLTIINDYPSYDIFQFKVTGLENGKLADYIDVIITQDGVPIEESDDSYKVIYRDEDMLDPDESIRVNLYMVGTYEANFVLKGDAKEEYYLAAPEVLISLDKADAPIAMELSSQDYYVGDKLEVELKEAELGSNDELQSIAIWATNGTETLAEQTVQGADLPATVTWELPEGESAQGEWTIYASCTVTKAGKDISDYYEQGTASFQVNEGEPHPTATASPTASPTPSSMPTVNPTVTPKPTASPTSKPTASPTASPSDEAETPSPKATLYFDLPQVEPLGNVLYDDYLGTGGGLDELGIVRNATGQLAEYELLSVLQAEDRTSLNTLLVIAQPDADGAYGQRSLELSGLQLAQLWQRNQISWLELRNGEADMWLSIEELLSGDAAKLIDWALTDPAAASPEALDELPDATLTVEQLQQVRIEMRIEPGEQGGYRFDVYLWAADRRLSLAELLPSLKVGLNAGAQGDEAERAEYVDAHALCTVGAAEAVDYLESMLMETAAQYAGDMDGTCEWFQASLDGDDISVQYDPEKPLAGYLRWALCADWAGEFEYRMAELDD